MSPGLRVNSSSETRDTDRKRRMTNFGIAQLITSSPVNFVVNVA